MRSCSRRGFWGITHRSVGALALGWFVVVASCGRGTTSAFSADGGAPTDDGGIPTDGGAENAPGCPTCGFGDASDGTVSGCTPKTCAGLGYNCGMNVDNCGNIINCGGCDAGHCGGGGFSVCGTGGADAATDGPTCVSKTCAQLGYDCGMAVDNCGMVINCGGICTTPQTCGGAGTPNVCGFVPCTGLCLKQVACDSGTTSISGTVVAATPAGVAGWVADPVPNVLVYIPNGTVQPFAAGVQCNQCGADVTGAPLVETTTDFTGAFTLNNVPVTPNMPLVIQLGRWRRQLTISAPVTACAGVPTAVGAIAMPSVEDANDDIPLTAISTGAFDPMECVLLKMGVAANQFSLPSSGGRIQMYQGDGADMGAGTPDETALVPTAAMANPAPLDAYDQVIFPCWGQDPTMFPSNTKTPAQQSNVINYTSNGGRVFATHFSYSWLYNVQPFEGTASWTATTPGDDVQWSSATATIPSPTSVPTPPPDVIVFYEWMNHLAQNGATNGQFNVVQPRNDLTMATTAPGEELWVNATAATGETDGGPQNPPTSFPLLFTVDTPVAPDAGTECGKVIFSDFHVAAPTGTTCGGTSQNCCPQPKAPCSPGLTCYDSYCITYEQTFPAECGVTAGSLAGLAPMTPQEKALEYLIWDLASCVPPTNPGTCVPGACPATVTCGPAGDGCGNIIDCGACVAPATCGGGGISGQCGTGNKMCVSQTCATQGFTCGYTGDGCGNVINCGDCTPPLTCGGGGVAGNCGGGAQ